MTRISSFASIGAGLCALAVLACEGEPPKFPNEPPLPPPAAEPAPEEPAAAAPAPAAPAPASSAATPGAPCARCNCMGERGAAPAASASGTAPAPVGEGTPPAAEGAPVAPAVGVAPTTQVVGSIVGHVSTTPPNAAAHAVVYLEDAPIVPGPTLSGRIDNRKMAFIPFVDVVAAGGRVVFSNGDPFPHNVFSTGKDRFDLGLVQPKAATSHVFKNPGVYPLLCNLHPNMLGYVVVSPSSFFAKANARGEFEIKNVPPGTYKVTAWAPREQPATQPVTVQAGAAVVSFDLQR